MNISTAISVILAEQGRKVSNLIKDSGMASATVRRVIANTTNPQIDNLEAVAVKGLGIKLSELIARAETYEAKS